LAATCLHAEINGADRPSPKKVLVLGGDGFCGWPTSLYLSDRGHDVVIVDNLSRRNIDIELGCDSLTPIQSPEVSEQFLWCCTAKHKGKREREICRQPQQIVEEQPSQVWTGKEGSPPCGAHQRGGTFLPPPQKKKATIFCCSSFCCRE
jgi:hypothetical protein